MNTLPSWPPRKPDAHKGDFGRVLIAGGSRGMSGAAALAGSAALRVGAGLVRVATPASVAPIVAALNPCYTTHALPEDADGRLSSRATADLLRHGRANDVLAIGPGLGQSAGLRWIVSSVIPGCHGPVVIDADALNNIVGQTERLREWTSNGCRLVLTPHPGEFARLLGVSTATIQADRENLATNFAREHGVVVLLKGRGTFLTDGSRSATNTTGNPGMATGGTGDVLTGIIAGLIGQGFEPFEAARLGAYLHGLSGDLARDRLGEPSIVATDLLEALPAAILTLPKP